MIRIAIVEDEPEQIEQVVSMLKKFEETTGINLDLSSFTTGEEFLDGFSPGDFNILLLDIQMPGIDGMTVATRIREVDKSVTIMFITNIIQYAVQGYSVRALDFFVKPLKYESFIEKLQRAIDQVGEKAKETVCLRTVSGMRLFELNQILYAEIVARKLMLHTINGYYHCNDTMQSIEKTLDNNRFYRCHAGFLVNLDHVRQIDRESITVGERQIPISRYRYKGLVDALTRYLGRRPLQSYSLSDRFESL